MFDECAQNCDHLICFLHDDPSKERPKKLKPIHTLSEREIMLKSLVQIKEIISYSTEAELYKLISSRSIDVRFLGDDYKNKDFTGRDKYLDKCYFNQRPHTFSSSELRERVAEKEANKSS